MVRSQITNYRERLHLSQHILNLDTRIKLKSEHLYNLQNRYSEMEHFEEQERCLPSLLNESRNTHMTLKNLEVLRFDPKKSRKKGAMRIKIKDTFSQRIQVPYRI